MAAKECTWTIKLLSLSTTRKLFIKKTKMEAEFFIIDLLFEYQVRNCYGG